MGYGSFSGFQLVPLKDDVNLMVYKDILLDIYMFMTLQTQFGDGPFLFHQGCASVYKVRSKIWRNWAQRLQFN